MVWPLTMEEYICRSTTSVDTESAMKPWVVLPAMSYYRQWTAVNRTLSHVCRGVPSSNHVRLGEKFRHIQPSGELGF